MDLIEEVKAVLAEVLSLGERSKELCARSALLGSLPELDSMAVITVITSLEDRFGIAIDDDEISASIFETIGSLVAFVDHKLLA